MSENVCLCPQHKDIQFRVIDEKGNLKIITFKKLESEKFSFFSLKITYFYLFFITYK